MSEDRAEMDETATQAPAALPNPEPWVPHNFSRFDVLVSAMQSWRRADHEDNLVICRSDVIAIIEGVDALKRETVTRAAREIVNV